MKITKAKIITLILVCASVFLIGQTKPVQDTRRGSSTYGKWFLEGKVYTHKPYLDYSTGGYIVSERGQPIPRKPKPTLSSLEERIEELEKSLEKALLKLKSGGSSMPAVLGSPTTTGSSQLTYLSFFDEFPSSIDKFHHNFLNLIVYYI